MTQDQSINHNHLSAAVNRDNTKKTNLKQSTFIDKIIHNHRDATCQNWLFLTNIGFLQIKLIFRLHLMSGGQLSMSKASARFD